jgi:hypothetical protein
MEKAESGNAKFLFGRREGKKEGQRDLFLFCQGSIA